MVKALKQNAGDNTLEDDHDLNHKDIKKEENDDLHVANDDADDVPLNALKQGTKKKLPRGRPSIKKKTIATTATTEITPKKKKRGRPKKEDSPNTVIKVYATPNKKNLTTTASISKNKTMTANNININNNTTSLKTTPTASSLRPTSNALATTTKTPPPVATTETTSPPPTKKRPTIKKEKGKISITITPEMIESTTRYSVSELMHKPSKWMEAYHEPLRRLFTMIQENPEYHGFKKKNTTTTSGSTSSGGNQNMNNKEVDEEDEMATVGCHSLVRMEGTRRGKCNFVMVDPEDGELVQCGNITRFRCKECSERAGRNRYFCIDIEEDGLHSKSCFHLHRTMEYCKLAQHAGSIL